MLFQRFCSYWHYFCTFTWHYSFVLQIIARVSVDNRTRALVKGLQKVTDVKLLTARVEELSFHLLEFPESRGVAIKVSSSSFVVVLAYPAALYCQVEWTILKVVCIIVSSRRACCPVCCDCAMPVTFLFRLLWEKRWLWLATQTQSKAEGLGCWP